MRTKHEPEAYQLIQVQSKYLFNIIIHDKELQTMDNTSGMDPIYRNVGQYVSGYWLNKTHYHKNQDSTMLQARIHFQHSRTPRRSSRNWNAMEKFKSDFL